MIVLDIKHNIGDIEAYRIDYTSDITYKEKVSIPTLIE